MSLSHSLRFLRRYIASPSVTGAIAPSSRRLAEALTGPFARCDKPARVLEVGAGTGAVTRVIGEHLGPEDRLDVCEIQSELADVLERDVLSQSPFREAMKEGRVRLIRGPVEELVAPETYDFVICGLPFTAFAPGDVRRIMRVIQRSVKPGGVFSYFEYVALRRLSCTFGVGTNRKRVRQVSRVMDHLIAKHQVRRDTVLLNVPPAYGRHWRFASPTPKRQTAQ